MTNRIETLRRYIDAALQGKPDEWCKIANVHLYGVAQACTLIALRRGEDAELAAMAGMLHDFCTFRSEHPLDDHAAMGAVLAREVLVELGLTTPGETQLICAAIHNHSDKGGRFDAFTEILIDADVMQHCLYDITMPVAQRELDRYDRLCGEFCLRKEQSRPLHFP